MMPSGSTSTLSAAAGATIRHPQKVWFITGTSSGLGRALVLAALARNDRVIASARSISKIQDLTHARVCPNSIGANINTSSTSKCNTRPTMSNLRLMQLDVTEGPEALSKAAKAAVSHWGRVDVVVNNAGRGMFGIGEEIGNEGYRTQFETNFFGPLDVTHAFLPHMRARRDGTIVFIGSRSSWRASLPLIGPYAASKAALNAAAEALSEEVSPLGIRVLNVLPGGLRTRNWHDSVFLPPNPRRTSTHASEDKTTDSLIRDYDETRNRTMTWMRGQADAQPGDPEKAAQAIVDVVHGDALKLEKSEVGEEDKKEVWPDLDMLVLGSDAEQDIRGKCERVVRNLNQWESIVQGVNLQVPLK